MTDAERERLRSTFGADADLYDRARPGYPPQLFDDLAVLAELSPQSRVLEIGCGTGQATRSIAQLGCTVVAVELSPEMAAVAERNLRHLPNVTIEVTPFETWTPPPAISLDLVVSATAFHWVDPAVRVQKAADLLHIGGTLAVIHTDHIAGGTRRFFVDAQSCYERFDPTTTPGWRQPTAADILDDPSEIDSSRRFGAVRFRRYEWEQEYPTRGYLDLLTTYSPIRVMPESARNGLLACLGRLIDRNHGGRIRKRYLTRMAVARKAG